MEPTIIDLEKMLKDNKEAFKQVQAIKKANQEKYARKTKVNNFKKIKTVKVKSVVSNHQSMLNEIDNLFINFKKQNNDTN